jgi:hypothetical protein
MHCKSPTPLPTCLIGVYAIRLCPCYGPDFVIISIALLLSKSMTL